MLLEDLKLCFELEDFSVTANLAELINARHSTHYRLIELAVRFLRHKVLLRRLAWRRLTAARLRTSTTTTQRASLVAAASGRVTVLILRISLFLVKLVSQREPQQ